MKLNNELMMIVEDDDHNIEILNNGSYVYEEKHDKVLSYEDYNMIIESSFNNDSHTVQEYKRMLKKSNDVETWLLSKWVNDLFESYYDDSSTDKLPLFADDSSICKLDCMIAFYRILSQSNFK